MEDIEMEEMREFCLQIAHITWRSYMLALGEETPISPTDHQRESMLIGVDAVIAEPEMTPEMSHEAWLEFKEEAGWKWGPVKDEEAKTHPDILPYSALPATEKHKDQNFQMAVREGMNLYHGFVKRRKEESARQVEG